MIYRCTVIFACLTFFLASAFPARAQSTKEVTAREAGFNNLKSLDDVPAIPGYEKPLVDQLSSRLAAFHPQVDNIGDVVVTLGSGAPHRLLVTGIDEPGFVVSAITDDGRPPLAASGLKLKDRLTAVAASLDRVAKKGR